MSSKTELRRVEKGLRSSLYASKEGNMYRLYHDTKKWEGPLRLPIDEKGVPRCSQNRRASLLVDSAWNEDEKSYRGGDDCASRSPHLCNAHDRLREGPPDVDAFAALCGVKRSTAWSYACKVVERWPRSRPYASRLVYGPLLKVCEEEARKGNTKGTLREVMKRVHTLLSHDMEWRTLSDPYSHLRLCRIIVTPSR